MDMLAKLILNLMGIIAMGGLLVAVCVSVVGVIVQMVALARMEIVMPAYGLVGFIGMGMILGALMVGGRYWGRGVIGK